MTADRFTKAVYESEVDGGHIESGVRDDRQRNEVLGLLDMHKREAFRKRVGQLAKEIRAEADAEKAQPEAALAN